MVDVVAMVGSLGVAGSDTGDVAGTHWVCTRFADDPADRIHHWWRRVGTTWAAIQIEMYDTDACLVGIGQGVQVGGSTMEAAAS